MVLATWMTLFACKPPAPTTPVELAGLRSEQEVEGFSVQALYVDDADAPLGVRLTHAHTGFTVALFQLPTAPQAYLWVNTVPVSDRGEPHTQEHLLLGKGNRGRAVASQEDLSLVDSSAFTEQLRTVYHFHTTAGPDVFFDVLEGRLGALLYPDYTDEEIRREVHHYGVREDPNDGSLALEEKGTVYNEMDSSMQGPGDNLWKQVGRDLYGTTHPLAFSAGGLPDAIREMTPEHIRSFHQENYHLANMGMIAMLPPEVPLPTALAKLDAVLRATQPEAAVPRTFKSEATLPPPRTASFDGVRETHYPNRDAAAEAGLMVVYPPRQEDLEPRERWLLSILLSGLAGNDSANLYRTFVDRSQRERDIGATDVGAWVSNRLGNPVHISLLGMPALQLDDEDVDWAARRIRSEFEADRRASIWRPRARIVEAASKE